MHTFFRARVSLIFLLTASIATSLATQTLSYRQGELIVQLQPTTDGKQWADDYELFTNFRRLIRSQNIWLLQFDFAAHSEAELRARINRDAHVLNVQYNRLTSLRSTTPDDPLYPNQWQYNNTGQIGGLEGADINVCSAWDVTTGGLTINGDTIVVCVIDNGVDEDHEDLVPNIWINRDEIPDNGIDDDNNGFIDDYRGWNTASNNNNINGGTHGTSVTGIVGARGDNGIGLSGVNWTTQVMIVRNNFNASESEVIEAYGYALDARIDYDNSGGTAGAYVVATNASWGIDNGDPDDSPIWCALYDTLGTHGILNAGATTNSNTNVDVEGDLPTACTSEYLLGVTNINTDDEKVNAAGFGLQSIDLGAHGEDVFTTTGGNNYGPFGGTSAATPMVTGAIGLLYSAPSAVFGELLTSDPAAAALLIRSVILDNARPISSLAGITVTGGVLDLGSAMDDLINNTNSCLAPSSIELETIGATGIRVNWNVINSVASVSLRYRVLGTSTWITITGATSPTELMDLQQCQVYELQLLSNCGNTTTASETLIIETDGCCRIPEMFSVTTVNNQSFQVGFSQVLAAVNYQIRYRPEGESIWQEQTAANSPIVISGLDPCTTYEVEISSNCDTTVTDFGDRMLVQTSGCGTCLDADYCIPQSIDNENEYIAGFNFGNLYANQSGQEMDGYRNFGETVTLEAAREAIYPLVLQPDFSNDTFSEVFRIWIDFDQNGFFSSGELVADVASAGGEAANVSIEIPATAQLGSTRMRVVMRFLVAGSACSVNNFFGEVEDYCINIVPSPGCERPQDLEAVYDENSEQVTLTWSASAAPGGSYLIRYRPVAGGEWIEVMTEELSLTLDQIPACELYDVELYSECAGILSIAKTTVFNSCSSTNDPVAIANGDWSVSPNPTSGPVLVNYTGKAQLQLVEIIDLLGHNDYRSSNVVGNQLNLNAGDLPAGVYLVKILTDDGRQGVKRLVIR